MNIHAFKIHIFKYCPPFWICLILQSKWKHGRKHVNPSIADQLKSYMNQRIIIIFYLLSMVCCARAQNATLSGCVVDDATSKPVEFASILLPESSLWAITDEEGKFTVRNVPMGTITITVQCLGYHKRSWPMTITRNVTNLTLKLKEENLKLDEVTIVAKRKTDEATTSYVIDRTTLDNQQLLNVSDITTLLPGGKTVNSTLMSEPRRKATPRLALPWRWMACVWATMPRQERLQVLQHAR